MQILASLSDIITELDDNVAPVTDDNTSGLQISTARIIRGNLSNVIDNVTLQSWRTPEGTPEIIRVAAAKLIAAQHYFNNISKSTGIIDKDSFSQHRYDEAMAIINGIISGVIVIPDTQVLSTGAITDSDFFPVDDTDRAFTMGMEL